MSQHGCGLAITASRLPSAAQIQRTSVAVGVFRLLFTAMRCVFCFSFFVVLSACAADGHANSVKKGISLAREATIVEQCESLGKSLRVATKATCAPLAEANELVGLSEHKRPVLALRGGSAATEPGATRVLILGAIHGDELTAGWLAMQWARFAPPATDGAPFSVRHVPITNPDGVFDGKPSRTNARGVDLNRNFPTPNWAAESVKWWNGKAGRDARRWPGKTAGSEAETQNIISLIKSFKPSVIVSIHAPLGVLDYDGGGLPPERIGSIWLDVVGIYPGSLGHYASRVHGTPVLTVELPHALKVVSEKESARMWQDLFVWVKKYSQHDASTK
jgi:murein peptide amidase A